MKTKYDQKIKLTCSSSGTPRLPTLLIMFDDVDEEDDCASGSGAS